MPRKTRGGRREMLPPDKSGAIPWEGGKRLSDWVHLVAPIVEDSQTKLCRKNTSRIVIGCDYHYVSIG